jgi:hypothetical protein
MWHSVSTNYATGYGYYGLRNTCLGNRIIMGISTLELLGALYMLPRYESVVSQPTRNYVIVE